ncbi:MAG: MMPL family transporter, partial [Planctomycetes bacterium]|nr:MMPL family transporter [Planctomycetota bacterium]
MTAERRALALGALVLAALGLFVAMRLSVVADIAHFLPDDAADTDVHLARELVTSALSRTMVVVIDAPDDDIAARASREFEAELRREPRVAAELVAFDAGPPAGIEDALWQIYEPHRFAFLAPDAAAAAERLTPAALAEAAASLKRRLATPASSLLARVVPGDPLLILPELFQRLIGGTGDGLRVVDGRFLTERGAGAVCFVTTASSASDGSAQRVVLDGLQAAFAAVDARHGDELELGVSATGRFAARAEAAIRADIQRVSIGSTVGLIAFLLVVFRSLRLVLLVAPVLATAFLAGTAACQLAFGQVHGLTLAFGAALIGVSIDYAVHFHCHHVFAPEPEGPRATLRAIWTPLVVGAATTVVGFFALMLSSFPGLRQLAVFAVAGILAALLATRLFLPGLAARGGEPTAVSRAIVRRLGALFSWRGRRRGWLAVPLIATLGCAAFGLPRLQWNDGVAALNRLDPELLAADAAVRERVVRYEQGRVVLAMADDEQTALEHNDLVVHALTGAVERGELGGFRNIATLVPSARRQREVDRTLRDDAALWDRVRTAFAAEGFRPEALQPFRDALRAAAPEPLVPGDLAETPLGVLVRPFRIVADGRVGFLTFLRDVRDEPALRRTLAGVPGRLLAIEGALSAAYGAYRERLLELWLLGLVAVLALVALRHRAVRPTAIACVPALLAAAGTVGLLALFDQPLNMLSLVALLMIVSMGVDYGVFLAENHTAARRLDATCLAVFVAGVSTALGFGLLAISEQPALRGIGLTSGVGVLLCLVLAPAT